MALVEGNKEANKLSIRVNTRCCLEILKKIKNRLAGDNIPKFDKSCFGSLLNLQDVKFNGQLMVHLFLNQISDSSTTKVVFKLANQNSEFGPVEFALITGLRFGVKPQCPKKSNFYDKNFPRIKGGVKLEHIEQAFLNADSNSEDCLKLALLWIVYGLLLADHKKKNINMEYLHLVDNLDDFNVFPWGVIAFEYLVANIRGNMIQTSNAYPGQIAKPDGKYTNRLECLGFSFALQCWCYEAVPSIAKLCASPSELHQRTGSPRILNWKSTSSSSLEELKSKSFIDNLIVLSRLDPFDYEVESSAYLSACKWEIENVSTSKQNVASRKRKRIEDDVPVEIGCSRCVDLQGLIDKLNLLESKVDLYQDNTKTSIDSLASRLEEATTTTATSDKERKKNTLDDDPIEINCSGVPQKSVSDHLKDLDAKIDLYQTTTNNAIEKLHTIFNCMAEKKGQVPQHATNATTEDHLESKDPEKNDGPSQVPQHATNTKTEDHFGPKDPEKNDGIPPQQPASFMDNEFEGERTIYQSKYSGHTFSVLGIEEDDYTHPPHYSCIESELSHRSTFQCGEFSGAPKFVSPNPEPKKVTQTIIELSDDDDLHKVRNKSSKRRKKDKLIKSEVTPSKLYIDLVNNYDPFVIVDNDELLKFTSWYSNNKESALKIGMYDKLLRSTIFDDLLSAGGLLIDKHIDLLMHMALLKVHKSPNAFEKNWTCVDLEFWTIVQQGHKFWSSTTTACAKWDWGEGNEKTLFSYLTGVRPNNGPRLSWRSATNVYGFAIVNGNHWVLYEINFKAKHIKVYDPLTKSMKSWPKSQIDAFGKLATAIPSLLHVPSKSKKDNKKEVKKKDDTWSVRCCRSTPQTINAFDCGILCIKMFECLITGRSFSLIDTSKSLDFRKSYIYELWKISNLNSQ